MNPSNPDPDRRSTGSKPDAGNGTTRQKLEDGLREAKDEVGTQAREKADAGKSRLADGADALSNAIDAAAKNLDDHDRQGLARYARDLSSTLANAAGQLEGRSVDELASDAKRLARNNPALFMLGSIAVGFGLSRFLKATAERDHQDDDTAARTDALPSNGSAGVALPGRQLGMSETDATPAATGSGNGRGMS